MRIRMPVAGSLLIVAAVLVAGCGPGEPTASGTPEKLQADVELVRDKLGVTHVYAKNDHDAFYGAGYAMARDRLFQMETVRRRALGRLSELFGQAGLADDRQSRVMGFGRLGVEDVKAMRAEAPNDAALLDAWAAGVNARIDEIARGDAPRPFGFRSTELDFLPEPWTAEHAAGVGKLLAFGLSSTLDFDLLASVIGNVAKDASEHYPLLMPTFDTAIVGAPGSNKPNSDPASISRPGASNPEALKAPGASALPAMIRRLSDEMGSNNWAVDGAHSHNGRPLLCGDPHQPLSSPQNFWPLHMSSVGGGGTLDVIGFAFVGTPMVELGHNARIGWTATTNFADVTDIFDVDAAADHVTLGDGSHPIATRTETIHVLRAGGKAAAGEWDDVTLPVDEVPGIGVMLPDEILPVPRAFIAKRNILFAWTGFRPSREALAYLALDRAAGLDEFERAADRIEVGALNLLAADATGIDYHVHALIPDRGTPGSHPMPWHIVDGSDPASLWTRGYLGDDKLPRLRSPARGYISSANNDPWGFTADGNVDNDPFYYGAFYAAGFRAHHIDEALGKLVSAGKVSRADMEKLQSDVHSPMADTVLPLLADAVGALDSDAALATWKDRADVRDLAARLAKWNGDFGLDASEPVVFLGLEWFAAKRTFADKFNSVFATIGASAPPFFLAGLRSVLTSSYTGSDYFLPSGGKRALLVAALADTADWLTARFGGTDGSRFKLSDINTAVFKNKYVPALQPAPIPVAGAPDTIFVTEAAFFDGKLAPLQSLASKEISLYRMAVQFGDDGVPEADVQFARGADGDPAGAHYADRDADWQAGRYVPLPFRKADVDAATESKQTLEAPQ